MEKTVKYGNDEFVVRGLRRKEFAEYSRLEKSLKDNKEIDEIEFGDKVMDFVFHAILPDDISRVDNLAWHEANELYMEIMSLTGGTEKEELKNLKGSGNGQEMAEQTIATPVE